MRKPSEERLERLKLGISGTDVARAIKVGKTMLYYYETGKRPMPDWVRDRIRKYLRKVSA